MANNPPALLYETCIRAALPRVISMLDREPMSKTYGCADRVFWSWKFTDFPGARFQEIAYTLAHLADSFEFPFVWLKAAMHFWMHQQHPDGSFDEAYPYERSLAATAFTGFYVGQAFLKTQERYSPDERTNLIRSFRNAGEWLCRNDERHGVLSNHLAAAAAALQTIAEITGEQRFITRRQYFVDRILQHQSPEGWYEEYGGADPGYQTHTTFYLGYVWIRTNDLVLLESLKRSVSYFRYFIHTNGSIGGEYASRNTRFFMPAGFEILADACPEAASVATYMRQSVSGQLAVGLEAMDTYNVLPLINNYCFAMTHAKHHRPEDLPALPLHISGITHFAHSGHIVINTSAYQVIIGTSKGGIISAFSKTKNGACWSDSGIAITFADGATVCSQGLHCNTTQEISKTCVEIDTQFVAVNQMIMSPFRFMAFRIITITTAVFPDFAYYLKRILVNLLVRRKKQFPVRLIRRISWNESTITVHDTIRFLHIRKIRNAWIGGRFSGVHMGSSRYFEWHELADTAKVTPLSDQQIQQLNDTGTLAITREWQA